MPIDEESFFWKSQRGEFPAPEAAKTLGFEFLEIDGENGVVSLEFEGRPEFANPVGNIQGGFLAAMLDDTMGPALACTLSAGEFAPTIDLNVQFLRPGEVGRIQAVGRIDKKGKDVCYLSGELMQNGKILARATASALIRRNAKV